MTYDQWKTTDPSDANYKAPFTCDLCGEDADDVFVAGEDDIWVCQACGPAAYMQFIGR